MGQLLPVRVVAADEMTAPGWRNAGLGYWSESYSRGVGDGSWGAG